MKIAIICPYWNPPQFYGGISRVVFELRKVWLKQGHTVHIYALDTEQINNRDIFQLFTPKVPLRLVWHNMYLAWSRRLDAYDIIFPQAAMTCLFLDKNRCVPFIHTLSGIEHKVWWRFWRYTHGLLEKIALRGIQSCMSLSDDTTALLTQKHKISSSAILEINNGVDYHTFRPAESFREDYFVVFTAGRFIPRKRFDILIRAFALFASSHDDVLLHIAGDGQLRDDLHKLVVELDIDKKVEFLGLLDHDAILRRYQKAALFVLPSCAEGMPMVVLEAQACGLPVIIGNFASAEDLVEDGRNGFIMHTSHPQDWANRLESLYTDREAWRNFSREARQRIVKQFGWDAVASQILAKFETSKLLALYLGKNDSI